MLPLCSCWLRVRDDDDVDLLLVAVVFVVVVVVVVALVSVTVVPAVAVVVVFFAGWWYSGHCCRGAIRPGRGGCPKFWRERNSKLTRWPGPRPLPLTHSHPKTRPVLEVLNSGPTTNSATTTTIAVGLSESRPDSLRNKF